MAWYVQVRSGAVLALPPHAMSSGTLLPGDYSMAFAAGLSSGKKKRCADNGFVIVVKGS
jgi:hypothetical protein